MSQSGCFEHARGSFGLPPKPDIAVRRYELLLSGVKLFGMINARDRALNLPGASNGMSSLTLILRCWNFLHLNGLIAYQSHAVASLPHNI